MSAPNTDIEKQKQRHKGPLSGMALVVTFAAVLLLGLVIWLFAAGNEPEDTGPEVEVIPGQGATLEEGDASAVEQATGDAESN